MSYTIIIVIITVLISIAAFNNKDIENKLILWPREMNRPEQYYRLLPSGFIHGDWNHLLFNMYALYSFGIVVENYMGTGGVTLAILYLTGIVVASLPSFIKNRNNSFYRSLGASGGVSAIVFFTIYYSPWSKIGIIFIPIGIPSIVFALLYIAYTVYMARRGSDNINHDAHLWGCLYGAFFAFMIDPTHGVSFINEITHPS
jgi:membrane associated rhomboid family serine protease